MNKLALVALVLLATRCTDGNGKVCIPFPGPCPTAPTVTPDPDMMPPLLECADIGERCDVGVDCCSLACHLATHTCLCAPDGSPCDESADCCSDGHISLCISKTCEVAIDQTPCGPSVEGEDCGLDSDCASCACDSHSGKCN